MMAVTLLAITLTPIWNLFVNAHLIECSIILINVASDWNNKLHIYFILNSHMNSCAGIAAMVGPRLVQQHTLLTNVKQLLTTNCSAQNKYLRLSFIITLFIEFYFNMNNTD